MNIKSDNLANRFYGDLLTGVDKITVEEMLQNVLNETAVKHNFKPINVDGVYSEVTNTFHEDVKVYSLLYTLGNFSTIQGMLKDAVNEIYQYYEAVDVETFYDKCINITQFLNQGKLTKKQKTKAHSIYRSLDMIKNLDEDYCHFLVNKYLSKDEFVDLDSSQRLLIS
jgi:hypothetical protein